MEPTTQLHQGDCRDILKTLPDNSIDSVVTDPPYELGFMGKKWDNTGIAYDTSMWAEVLRVLKPGGHLLAFGGTRTYHRMAVAIEDAGFEIRDSIHWIYGSGFPKSLDVSKAIDKCGGAVAGFEDFRDAVKAAMKANGVSRSTLQDALGNYMLSHYLTAGSQPAVPNYRDYLIIRNTVNLGDTFDHLFSWEAEREVVGNDTKARSTSGKTALPTVGGATVYETWDITVSATEAAKQWNGWGTALKPAHEPIVVARKPLIGTVAANVLQHGTGALNIDGCRIGDPPGRWPANVIHDGSDEVTAMFPEAGNKWKRNYGEEDYKGRQYNGGTFGGGGYIGNSTYADSGSAARFFYAAKASRAERNAGLDKLPQRDVHRYGAGIGEGKDPNAPARDTNFHPTVKPLALMRYLLKLVTPPNGITLDPFAGSGTTLAAAIHEGFNSIGIELTPEYHPIIQARIQHAQATRKPIQ
jgi:DNA modification methylase